MGLFDFFNKKNIISNSVEKLENENKQAIPEIPENVFIEKDKSQINGIEDRTKQEVFETGINYLYQFLEQNFESKGYDDALVNPDSSHLEENIQVLKNNLERVIRKVKSHYSDLINEINFHITSRSRSGMVDTVEELTSKKEIAENHIKLIDEIEMDSKNNKGSGHGIILSYRKGFRNGLAAISHHSIIKRFL